MAAREKLILKRSYKKGDYVFDQRYTSKQLAHIPPEVEIKQMEMLEDGIIEKNGEEFCFHTIRILMKPAQVD